MPSRLDLELRRLLPAGRHGWPFRAPGFTPQEVRRLLSSLSDDPRTLAVARCAARVDIWLPPEPHISDCPYYAWRYLPRIVLWHARGEPLEAIGRRLGGVWGVERALDAACARMAASLNRDPEAYGLPRHARAPGRARHRGRH